LPPRYFRDFKADDGFPIERADVLDQLKIFGDIHARSRFLIRDTVQPVFQVVGAAEAQPGFYGGLRQAVGAAGTFSAVALSNPPASGVIARPVMAGFSSSVSHEVGVGLRPFQFLGGAVTSVSTGLLDSRRGFVTTSALNIQGSADAANVLGVPFFPFAVPGNNTYQFLPIDLLKALILAPGSQLIIAGLAAVQDLFGCFAWLQEPAAQATRGSAG
jgi:hypothetical protein